MCALNLNCCVLNELLLSTGWLYFGGRYGGWNG